MKISGLLLFLIPILVLATGEPCCAEAISSRCKSSTYKDNNFTQMVNTWISEAIVDSSPVWPLLLIFYYTASLAVRLQQQYGADRDWSLKIWRKSRYQGALLLLVGIFPLQNDQLPASNLPYTPVNAWYAGQWHPKRNLNRLPLLMRRAAR